MISVGIHMSVESQRQKETVSVIERWNIFIDWFTLNKNIFSMCYKHGWNNLPLYPTFGLFSWNTIHKKLGYFVSHIDKPGKWKLQTMTGIYQTSYSHLPPLLWTSIAVITTLSLSTVRASSCSFTVKHVISAFVSTKTTRKHDKLNQWLVWLNI